MQDRWSTADVARMRASLPRSHIEKGPHESIACSPNYRLQRAEHDHTTSSSNTKCLTRSSRGNEGLHTGKIIVPHRPDWGCSATNGSQGALWGHEAHMHMLSHQGDMVCAFLPEDLLVERRCGGAIRARLKRGGSRWQVWQRGWRGS